MKIVYRPKAQRWDVVGEFVYRMFDPAGALLYIGTTDNMTARIIQHEASSPFFDPVTTVIDIEERPEWNGWDRYRAEAEAIFTEHPRWNIHKRDHEGHPDGPAWRWFDVALMHPGTFRPEVTHWSYERHLARHLRMTEAVPA